VDAILLSHRLLRRTNIELVHYVPEHTYTSRVNGVDANDAPVTDYLKVYCNDAGCRTAGLMRDLAIQLPPTITSVSNFTYLPELQVLIQRALPRAEGECLTDANAAGALAAMHGLRSAAASAYQAQSSEHLYETQGLVDVLFPDQSRALHALCAALRRRLMAERHRSRVLVHGDAHLGNLIPLEDGRVGVIDLDATSWGVAEDDLASFFAFRLWLQLRDGKPALPALQHFAGFVEEYNRQAATLVPLRRALVALAAFVVTQRIRRALIRGKLQDATDIERFMELSWQCLELSEKAHA
jgi:hypothetical protein